MDVYERTFLCFLCGFSCRSLCFGKREQLKGSHLVQDIERTSGICFAEFQVMFHGYSEKNLLSPRIIGLGIIFDVNFLTIFRHNRTEMRRETIFLHNKYFILDVQTSFLLSSRSMSTKSRKNIASSLYCNSDDGNHFSKFTSRLFHAPPFPSGSAVTVLSLPSPHIQILHSLQYVQKYTTALTQRS